MAEPSPLPFPATAVHDHQGLMVFVRGLELAAGIGVYDHEQGRLQRLVIDVTLSLDPGRVERLSDTVNYETIARAAREIAGEGHVELVETFAERLAAACMAHPKVRRCIVRVEKPGALEGATAAGCEVTLDR